MFSGALRAAIAILLFAGCTGRSPYLDRENLDDGPLMPGKDLISLSQERSFYLTQETKFRTKASEKWERQAKVSSPYEIVKYSENFQARAVINFERGIIRVETTAQRYPKVILAKVIRTTLLNPMNPQTVDLFSDRDKVQKGIPFLFGKVLDHEGQAIRWTWRANRYAQFLIDKELGIDTIMTEEGEKKRYFVTFPMRKTDLTESRNLPYRAYVKAASRRFGISEALILAIIQTESHFNPFATSSIPAYGLMQVVPASAGADAWRFLYKRRGEPSRRYLFDPKNNIEIGSAYLRLLLRSYLKGIKNPKSREYCAIAAYNTGAGNVLRTFSKERGKAMERINRMSHKAVYAHLRKSLPYRETRRYLHKVTRAKNRFYKR